MHVLLTDNMKYFWRIASWIINGFIMETLYQRYVYYVINFFPPRHYVNYIALSLVKLRFSRFRPTPLPSPFLFPATYRKKIIHGPMIN